MKTGLDITVVILTLNEEANLPFVLENVSGFCREVVILDSFSTDSTVAIAESYGAHIFQRKFDDFSSQRKHALEQLPIMSEWVLVLDADEYLSDELKEEIASVLPSSSCDAYLMKRRFYWKGKWIKRGYYPTKLIRLGRHGLITCDDRPINEHLICKSDKVSELKHDFIDFNRKGLADWLSKHNSYSDREARQLYLNEFPTQELSLFKSQYERKRWLRYKVWNRLPPIIRPFSLFIYRYVFLGGMFDGRVALQYHYLHAFFYRHLIELKLQELIKDNSKSKSDNIVK